MQVSSIITMEDTPELRLGVRCVLLQLFEHNEKAYRAAVQMMEECGKAAIVHPTGTGKSYIAFKLIEEHPADTIFWLSPSEYIFKTQIENLKRQAPDISLANVHFYTYAKLMCCATEELEAIAGVNPAYIILDEFHRVGAECWGASTLELLKLCPDAKILGLSATNIRYLDNNRDMAEELFDGHIASEMTLGEAIVRGILPAPKYVTTVYQYQKELTRYQNRIDNLRSAGIQDVNQKYLDALRRALEKADGLDEVFARHITNKSGKYIVFCANKEHMDEMISHVPEWFAGVNPDIAVYEAYSDDPGTDKAFTDFKADQGGRLKLLFCIDMLNEGVHVEGISGVILFRPTVSPIIYKQQIGRALTAGDSKTPLILDVVNNFEGLSSISGIQSELNEAVHRLFANGEGSKIVTEHFEVIEQVQDCRVLFERLQASLSSTWDHYFSEASIYYAEHRNLRVPVDYATSAGLHLGTWVQLQRLIRNGKRMGSLTEAQIRRLDNIGMIWDDRAEFAWKRGLEHAKAYFEEQGNLLVPAKYKAKDDFALGHWILTKRKDRSNGRMTEEEIRQLDALGMAWNAVSAKWERGYAEAAAYYEQYADLEVPTKYITESGLKLGVWISYQKDAYQKGLLSTEQIRRLEQIGMNWGERNYRRWMEQYHAAERYYQVHGDLDVPANYVTEDGIKLGKWIATLRHARKKQTDVRTKLTPERIAMLDTIGMQWVKPTAKAKTVRLSREEQWEARLECVKVYQKEHGNLDIPAKYKTDDGFWLGRWWYLQKKMLREEPGKLRLEQTEKLEEVLERERKKALPESA